MITLLADKTEKDIQVQVHPSQLKKAAREELSPLETLSCTEISYKLSKGLSASAYLASGNWVEDVEYYGGGHSREKTEHIRKATETDIEVMTKLNELVGLIIQEVM